MSVLPETTIRTEVTTTVVIEALTRADPATVVHACQRQVLQEVVLGVECLAVAVAEECHVELPEEAEDNLNKKV